MISGDRKQRELEHDRKILNKSEQVWGREGEAGRVRAERRAKMIADFCNLNTEKRVLEIGCGTGMLTRYLADTGANITATDIFPEFLDIAAKRTGDKNRISFRILDAENMDALEEDSFDAVCGLSILHHLDINKVFKNIRRVLRPGGLLAFSEPNMLNPQIALQKNIPIIKKWAGDSPDETAFFSWIMKKKLRNFDFADIMVQPFDFLHPAAPDFMVPIISRVGYILEKTPLIKEIAGSLFIGAKKI